MKSYLSLLSQQTPSLMYQLCKIRNVGQVEKSSACQLWFHKAAAHCTNILDTTQQTTIGRVFRYFFPSFRHLHSFNEITEVDTNALSESDCKLLMAKLARDYVAREPHYHLANYTLVALWAILILTVCIITLVAIGVVYTRFSGRIKNVFDEKQNRLKAQQTADNNSQSKETPIKLTRDTKNIEQLLKYDRMDSEDRVLNILKQNHNTTTKAEEQTEPQTTIYQKMNQLAHMVECNSVNLKVGRIETSTPLAVDNVDPILL